jgi:hypothetical protein
MDIQKYSWVPWEQVIRFMEARDEFLGICNDVLRGQYMLLRGFVSILTSFGYRTVDWATSNR